MEKSLVINRTGKFTKNLIITLGLLTTPVLAEQKEIVMVAPTQINIVGRQGAIATRRLSVRMPNSIIQPIQLIPPDLNSPDGTKIFPTEAVKIPGISSQDVNNPCVASTVEKLFIPKDNEMVIPICVDFKQAKSGEFASQLQIRYKGGEQLVPINIKVKDNWPLPLIVLFIGTCLGIAVSAYRSQGQPRDEILVRVGRMRSEIQEDTEWVKENSFQAQVENYLYDVRVGLQQNNLEMARLGIEQAEKVWAKWIKGRMDWLNQFAYWQKLDQRSQDLNPDIPYVQMLHQELADIKRESSTLEGPDKLREQLHELSTKLNKFLELQSLQKELRNLLGLLSGEEKAKWAVKIQVWEKQINQIQPSDLTDDLPLISEMTGAIAEISQLVEQRSGTSGISKGINISSVLAPPPSARPLSWEIQSSVAGLRLRWFTGTSYAIALLFLTGMGFNQLYVDNPTFGANPWKDYFTLMAWGFGAEATRDAVTKMVQGWGVLGLK